MDIEIRVRGEESVGEQPMLLWDSTWDNDTLLADWTLASPTETGNVGGLQAQHALHTAIILSLFTWKRAETYEVDVKGRSADMRGWWGDAVDIQQYEQPLGSKLWLIYRERLNETIARRAVDYANEALTPLVTQGAIASFTVDYEMDQIKGLLGLIIRCFSHDGTRVYDQRFSRIWRQEFR